MGAYAGGSPGGEGGADGGDRVQSAAGAVGHRGTRQSRPAVGCPARAVEVAPDGQVVEVVARPVGPGARLAEAGGRAQHDARVGGPQRLVADAETVHDARSKTLNDHVGFGGQPQEGTPSTIGFEVQEDAAHPPVGAVCVGRRGDVHIGVAGHRTHLDDVCTPVGQPPGGAHCGPHRGEVKHGDSVEERAIGGHVRVWSFWRIPVRSSWGGLGRAGR